MSTYRNLIFTKHSLRRHKLRGITYDMIYQAINYPDRKQEAGEGMYKFIKNIGGRQVQVVATYKSNEHKWLVISNWVKGEEDRAPLAWRIITLPFRPFIWLFKKKTKK